MSDIHKRTADLSPERKSTLLAELPQEYTSESMFPLSYGQQALWFLYKLAPQSWAYNVLFAARIHEVQAGAVSRRSTLDEVTADPGPLRGNGDSYPNIPVLQRAFQALIERHPSLRTTYTTHQGKPVQQVHKHSQVSFQETDASGWSQNELNNRLLEEAHRPFDLEQGPVLRVNLFTATEHILIVTVHHIAVDFCSLTVLLDELRLLYTYDAQALPPLNLQYTDYVRWQAEMLASAEGERLWTYWQKQLAGELPVLNLPIDRPRPPLQTYNGASHVFKLSDDLTRQLKAQSGGEALYTTLLAAFFVLLYRYTGQEDILVGSPTPNLRHEFLKIVGVFTNPIVLRADMTGNHTFRTFQNQVRQKVLDAFNHQEYPFSLLVERLHPVQDPSRSPLFQVMFILQQQRFDQLLELLVPSEKKIEMDFKSLDLEPLAHTQQEGHFDLTLEMINGDSLQGVLKYNTDLFESATIARMSGHFQALLSGVVANPDQPISTLPLLTGSERLTMLKEWNNAQVAPNVEPCIHQMFETQVKRTPDAKAVVFALEHLTYLELNARANRLAHHLQNLGVGPEVLVGICMERSLEIVVGILGILKAGGAYLFLDPAYPQERLNLMLQETQVPVLLTQRRVEVQTSRAHVVYLDDCGQGEVQKGDKNPASGVTAQNLAYVMYTSGSMGRPKGVTLTHANVRHYVQSINTELQINANDVYLHTASFSFSSSVRQLLVPLSQGAKVLIATYEQTRDPLKIFDVIQKCGVTVCDTVRSFWQYGLEALAGLDQASRIALMKSNLRLIVFSGGLLTWEIPKAIVLQLEHRPRIVNIYGQTETIGVSIYSLSNEFDYQVGTVPTGRPIPNTQVYILNSQLEPVPIGVTGELHVGGPGLARGYLNSSELTAERFIGNPFSDAPFSRIYKTGDLARYLPDGNIEVLDRIDNQVKLRGMRVELGEIESVLGQHPAVQSTAVAAWEDKRGDKCLVAYVVPNRKSPPIISEVRGFLREKLPEYMVPSAFMLLDALPLTPNGKVERRALPMPDQALLELERAYVAPRDPVELQLTKIWEEVLGVQPVGVRDSFFDLGGHSLKAVRLFAQIENTFGKNLPLATLFQAATVEQLAIVLQHEELAPWSMLVAIQTGGNKTPLFCVHGVDGNILAFQDLARYLDSDQPVYGLQPKGLDGKQTPHTRIEDMATEYVRQIRTVQPEGPYLLAGYSAGGMVAFEMAQQLQRQGQKVALLAMFDTKCGAIYSKPFSSRTWASRHLSNLLRLGPKEKLIYLMGGMKDRLGKIARKFYPTLEHSLLLSPKKSSPTSTVVANSQAATDVILTTLQQALLDYIPQAYSGRVLLFRSGEQPWWLAYDPELGWGGLVVGLEVYAVPGDHPSIIRANVMVLAEKLRACLEQAQSQM